MPPTARVSKPAETEKGQAASPGPFVLPDSRESSAPRFVRFSFVLLALVLLALVLLLLLLRLSLLGLLVLLLFDLTRRLSLMRLLVDARLPAASGSRSVRRYRRPRCWRALSARLAPYWPSLSRGCRRFCRSRLRMERFRVSVYRARRTRRHYTRAPKFARVRRGRH